MISDHDRSYYIGASDTQYVVGNWSTYSFERWYLTKVGMDRMSYSNDAMKAGTAYEHRILESLNLCLLYTSIMRRTAGGSSGLRKWTRS